MVPGSFAVARSGLRSPFRSPIATDRGKAPGWRKAPGCVVPELGLEAAVAPVEEHAALCCSCGSRPRGRACRRRSGPPPATEPRLRRSRVLAPRSRAWGRKLPSPRLRSTLTVSLSSAFATARSGLPSPFRSPTRPRREGPRRSRALAAKLPLPWFEQHAHGLASSSRRPGRACRRRSGRRSRPRRARPRA